jgi:hypothetical protein
MQMQGRFANRPRPGIGAFDNGGRVLYKGRSEFRRPPERLLLLLSEPDSFQPSDPFAR